MIINDKYARFLPDVLGVRRKEFGIFLKEQFLFLYFLNNHIEH